MNTDIQTNREIKFRGKRADNGEWVYGYLFVSRFETAIKEGLTFCIQVVTDLQYQCYAVNPDSVGQYTGLKDKNGKEVYECDLFRNEAGVIYQVVFGFCKKYAFVGWYALGITIEYQSTISNDSDSDINSIIEVIGNIYENPELINK